VINLRLSGEEIEKSDAIGELDGEICQVDEPRNRARSRTESSPQSDEISHPLENNRRRGHAVSKIEDGLISSDMPFQIVEGDDVPPAGSEGRHMVILICNMHDIWFQRWRASTIARKEELNFLDNRVQLVMNALAAPQKRIAPLRNFLEVD
jgi:hypothetical protein